ncbi:MAG: hypothetical protein AAF433_19350 [Bacteroidota bacterium]
MKRLVVFTLVLSLVFFSCEESVSPVGFNGLSPDNPSIGLVHMEDIPADAVDDSYGSLPVIITVVEVAQTPTITDQSATDMEELFGGRSPQIIGEVGRNNFNMEGISSGLEESNSCLLVECQRSIDEATSYLQGLAVQSCETMFMAVSCCDQNGPIDLVISVAPLCPNQVVTTNERDQLIR